MLPTLHVNSRVNISDATRYYPLKELTMSLSPKGLDRPRVGIALMCVLLALATLPQAYADNKRDVSPPVVTDPEASTPRLSVPEYRSPLSDYKPYQESDSPGWKQVNDRVGEIGGFRVYAREAFEPEEGPADTSEMEKDGK